MLKYITTKKKSCLGFFYYYYSVVYSVYLIAGRGSNKMNVGGNCQDFLKWGDQTNKQKDKKKSENKILPIEDFSNSWLTISWTFKT